MRKQTKLVAVLSAAALLAIGASMTSFAAKGWVEENGTWYYYDNTGEPVTLDWKKSGNNWFWLDADGAMATDTLVEDDNNQYYYVNANGAMVTNSWVAVEPGEDADADAPDHYWYYFGANGKAYKTSENSDKDITIKTVNGKKYGFDKEGKMFYGWVSEEGDALNDEESPFAQATYYFGDEEDGAMHTDWLQYNDGSDLTSELTGREYSDQDVMWFYFNTSTGKMVKADTAKDKLATKTVRGNKYAFDENGVMVYDWNNTASPNQGTPSKYFSDQTSGKLQKKTWVWAIPDADMGDGSDNEDETYRWFYVDGSGNTTVNTVKTINGKKYIFDQDGVMKSGLIIAKGKEYVDTVDTGSTDGSDLRDAKQYVSNDSGNTVNGYAYNLYYFGNDEEKDGSMKTGKNIKIEFQDDTYTMAFEKSSGKAMNKKDGSKIYKNGFLASADADKKYDIVNFTDDNATKYYVVGTTGTIVKAGSTAKDADGGYYAVYKSEGVEQDGLVPDSNLLPENMGSTKEEDAGIAYFNGDDEFAQQKARDYAKYGHLKGCVDSENDKWISSPKENDERCN